MTDEGGLIPAHGGYRKLRSFGVAQLVYDGTVVFCDRFVDKRSRTRDQMVQAARSGVQNIAEGSMASATSRKFELKLTAVARASLEELLLDYEDFLRQRGLRMWDKDSAEALAVRRRFRPAAVSVGGVGRVGQVGPVGQAGRVGRGRCSGPLWHPDGFGGGRGQHPHLSCQPGEFPSRAAGEGAGAAVPFRGRLHRAPLPRAVEGPPGRKNGRKVT